MNIKSRLTNITNLVTENVTLVAVSKTKPNEDILAAYDAGQRVFGENKALELAEKHIHLPEDIEWHFIGHLQTNKVKYIASFVHMLHAVDSIKLLKTINKEAAKHNRTISCLLQLHIAQESSKFGMSKSEVEELLNSDTYKELKNIKVCGVMGMATNSHDTNIVKEEFRNLKSIFSDIKEKYFESDSTFKEISMGMSNDFQLAIEEGSTMVRVGSSIFGTREYKKVD